MNNSAKDISITPNLSLPHANSTATAFFSFSFPSSFSTMAAATTNTYTYERLNGAREVRLITLLQGTGDETISLAIEHTSLDQRPAYDALSYVWGPQNPSYSVRCNDGSLAIGENLRDALRCLRKPDTPRVLWIDRIAINQQDVDERIQQVGLMADIYSSASLVIIWLGTADDYTETAFGLINDLTSQMLEYRKTQNSQMPIAKTENHPIQYPPSGAPVWSAVRSLLQRPWFSRVWTFQEIVLAQQAVLYCGTHTIRWRRLEAFEVILETFSAGPNNEDSRLKGVEKPLRDILMARTALQRPQELGPEPENGQLLLSLLPLLDNLRNRQATDPRDKVFALLNIACDAKNSDLKADYRKSLAEVYALTAKWLLRTQRSLAFLSLVEKKDKPDLVSWVPDFRYKDEWNFLHQPTQVFRGSHRVYNASGNTNATVIDAESNFQLTVRGIYVGTIVERTEPPGNLTNNVAIGARILDGGQWDLLARTCVVDGVYPPTGEPIDLAYHRLRIWDQLPTEGLNRRRRTSPPTQIPQPGPISYDNAKDALVRGASGDIGITILNKTTRKRMFKTETGYLGVAHRSIEIGDKVYVLMGGEMPFVLRPFGGNYFGFGGESYVHGIMDGEMLAVARANRVGLGRADIKNLAWVDHLGDGSWPFQTEELVLV
jgi:hypothetical protein